MGYDYSLLPWLVGLWVVTVAVIVWSRWSPGRRIPGAGLVLAYTANFTMIHLPGAAVYLAPWYWGGDESLVDSGLEVSLYGVMAFAVGCVVLAPLLTTLTGFPRSPAHVRIPERLLPRMYFLVGVGCYALLTVFFGTPTLTAILGAGWNLVGVGLGLLCIRAWRDGQESHFLAWAGVALALPLFTMLAQGYLGYGICALIAIVALIGTFMRPRPIWLLFGLVGVYVGLSFFVTYMRDRDDLREGLRSGRSFDERLEETAIAFTDFEWFDPYDKTHLERVDVRLNQNVLVGAAVRYLEVQRNSFADGETLVEAVTALVPRAFWPSKPTEAGSGDLVTRYTGIQNAPDTSVGIGQVMEFYINFGRLGVIGGFLVLGAILALIDRAAYQCLVCDDWHRFALWYLPGLSLLQAGGSLVEVTSSAAAAILLVVLVNRFVLPDLGGRAVGPEGHEMRERGGSLAR